MKKNFFLFIFKKPQLYGNHPNIMIIITGKKQKLAQRVLAGMNITNKS